ncbi:MAG: hypothetical protein IPN86_10485 [Saprospiraceae bacterium]|nr:hypothetical protein [Saprospiraceae bacterium]
MLKKSSKEHQLDMFSSPVSLFGGKAQSGYENPNGWHNLFRKEVVNRIDEELFNPLFSESQEPAQCTNKSIDRHDGF